MNSATEAYRQLVAEVQLFLLQEYTLKQWIAADADNFLYFKTQAAAALPQRKSSPPAAPPPQPAAPPLARKTLPPKAPPSPPLEAKEEKNEPQPKTAFAKEPIGKAAPPDLSEIRRLVAEKHPAWEYVEPPPYREKGAPVLVFAGKGETLLQQIGGAIQNQLAPTQILDLGECIAGGSLQKVVERQNLRLIVLDENALRAYPPLLTLYRPQMGTIGTAPVLVLTQVAELAHDPARKRAIWNTLKEKLGR